MICHNCANAPGLPKCQQCTEAEARRLKSTQLHARHIVALLESMGAKPAPVTDHRMRMRRMLFETWGYPSRERFGDYDTRWESIYVRSEVRTCASASFTTAKDRSTATRSSRSSSPPTKPATRSRSG